MAEITYEDVLKLAEQLKPEEQIALVIHLLQLALERQLTIQKRKALIQANISSVPFAEEPSLRREDWYDDDGR